MSELQPLIPQFKTLDPGVTIARYLPHPARPRSGPFVFFDYLPDLRYSAGAGTDVRPHPHIGLSTVSWLFAGRMHHRDSLGADLIVSPGDLLLMTSGRGIVHSERTPAEDRLTPHSLHMVQFWLALAQADETCAPGLTMVKAADILRWDLQPGLSVALPLGRLLGRDSGCHHSLDPFLADFQAGAAGTVALPAEARESALFLVSGALSVNQQTFTAPALVVIPPAQALQLQWERAAHWLWLGGEPLDGPRTVWWNLVASRPELIAAAKDRWRRGEFEPVAGDDSFIPLPAD
jgi:redox-sensitive bicupin YhaK (pirin superfamily)